MTSWRPGRASDPDGEDEWRYRDLAELDRQVADRLVREYAEVWMRLAELPAGRLGEVADTVELVVADEWEDDAPGTKRLRLRSWYTGSTYWLYDWDGNLERAVAWARDTADVQAGNVRFQRFRHGRTPWDDKGEERRTGPTPEETRAWIEKEAERFPSG